METLENVNGTDIRDRIIMLRGFRVIVDADLAELYGVSKRRLNEQVRRNISRFPPDFMFELSAAEKSKVVANCDDLSQLRYSPTACRNFHPQNASMGRVWSGFQRVSSGCQSVKVGNRNERV